MPLNFFRLAKTPRQPKTDNETNTKLLNQMVLTKPEVPPSVNNKTAISQAINAIAPNDNQKLRKFNLFFKELAPL